MNFTKKAISRSFISLILISTAFISCETEQISVTESSEAIDGSEATVLTEDEFLQSIVFEDANIGEENVAVDVLTFEETNSDGLSSISDNELEIRLDGLNTYFYVDNGEMKNWESYLVHYTTHSDSEGTIYESFSVDTNTSKKWIGAKVWGPNNNRATIRVVPFSGNNETYYWGKARTYYLWFDFSGGNTLEVTANSSDPNGK